MNLSQYRIETKRTVADLSSPILNSIHMTLGMLTEIVELVECQDPADILDESGDVLWYISNYCNFHDIELEQQEDPISVKYLNIFPTVTKFIGKLQDFDKKNLAYNKPYNKDLQRETVQRLFELIHGYIEAHGSSLEEAFDKNIQKLYIRFPDKATGELAINKDEVKEKAIFK